MIAIPTTRISAICQIRRYRSVLAHARVYQLMGLLYIHRLRYPFGQEDGKATHLSNTILRELEQVNSMTGKPLCYVTMPFIAAATEIVDPAKKIEALELVDTNVKSFPPRDENEGQEYALVFLDGKGRISRVMLVRLRLAPCFVLLPTPKHEQNLQP
jgi:hypothetical protein